MKAERNKTIDFTIEEGNEYLRRCIAPEDAAGIDAVLNKTIFGNCFEAMPLLPENSVDLLIADPPYNLDKDFDGSVFHKSTDDEYREYTRSWLIPAIALLKDTASVYVCCDWRSSPVVYEVLNELLIVRNRITWQREKGRGAKNNWKNSMEDIWFATVSDSYTFNVSAVMQRRRVLAPYSSNGLPKDWEDTPEGKFRNTYPSNFWDDISVPYWSMPENTAHPTQKPEKLMAKLILASSDPGDTVFDPFLGSGSSSVTAKKLGRNYIGIEQNAQYCAWAEKRLELAGTDTAIQGYSNGVFWERNTAALQKKYANRGEEHD